MAKTTQHPFRTAVEAKDFDAAEAALAPDVVFYPPIRREPLRGRGDVIAGLRFAAAAFAFGDDFRYIDELTGDGSTVALVFETEIDGQFLEGVDYLVLDDAGLVRELRISMRPISAVQKYLDFVSDAIATGKNAAAADE